jgi:hypothetical protein
MAVSDECEVTEIERYLKTASGRAFANERLRQVERSEADVDRNIRPSEDRP